MAIAIVTHSRYNRAMTKAVKIAVACMVCIAIGGIVVALLRWWGVVS